MKKKELFAALVKAQAEFGPLIKDSKGYNYKYAQLDQLLDVVRPVLIKHGLGVIQQPTSCEDKIGVRTILIHESGESLMSEYSIKLAKANDPQAAGSVITYFRRYALMALCGIAPEDDDGQGARNTQEKKANRVPSIEDAKDRLTERLIAENKATDERLKFIADCKNIKALNSAEEKWLG